MEQLQSVSNISSNHTFVAFNPFFLPKRKQIKIFSVSFYVGHAAQSKFKTFWKCKFPLKLSREVIVCIVCIEAMAFSFMIAPFILPILSIILYSHRKRDIIDIRKVRGNFFLKQFKNFCRYAIGTSRLV